jgi:hypothetical protein
MTPMKFILATIVLVSINIAIGWWVAVRTARRRRATSEVGQYRSRYGR